MSPIKRSLNSLAVSIVELVIGILLLVNPVGFTSGIIVAFGIVLMLFGVVNGIKYFRTEPEAAAVSQSLVIGMLQLLAGAFCAFCSRWFIVTFPVLTLVYGVLILVTGLVKFQWTVDIIRLKRRNWLWAAVSAAISILCGVVIITSPFDTTAVLWMFTGISLIVEAVLDMIGAIFGNRGKEPAAAGGEEREASKTAPSAKVDP